jgi:hypothetical protein
MASILEVSQPISCVHFLFPSYTLQVAPSVSLISLPNNITQSVFTNNAVCHLHKTSYPPATSFLTGPNMITEDYTTTLIL